MSSLHKLLLSFIILSVILRFSLINVNKGYWWDEAVYLGLSRNLDQNLQLGIPPPVESYRPILLPILISSTTAVLNEETGARIVVLSFSILSIVCVFFLGKKLYDEQTGLVSAILLGVNHLFLFYGQRIFTESIFITFYAMSLLFFFSGVEKNRNHLLLAGVFTGLCVLTKNFGVFLPIIFLTYILLRKRFEIFRYWQTYASILVCFLILSPLFSFAFTNYGGIEGFLRAQTENVPALNNYAGFYLIEFFDLFMAAGIFILFGLYSLIRRRRPSDVLVLTSIFIPLLFFGTILAYHKEARYLIPFFPTFFLAGAVSIDSFIKKSKKAAVILIIVLSGLSFVRGLYWVQNNVSSGVALGDACLYLKTIIGNNGTVISESYPYVYYFAGINYTLPPSDKALFYQAISEKNIRFVLICYSEPGNPQYLEEELQTGKFEKVKGFMNENGIEEAAIYRYQG
jgi:4-amino-4-deoxy-L-arabinose transferase-like glycosyltransferase